MGVRWRVLAVVWLLAGGARAAGNVPADPFASGQWPVMVGDYLQGARVVMDERVRVTGPRFAEDAMNVPITVDASGVGEVAEVIVLVDRNPIRKVLQFYPGWASPVLSFRFKLQQSSAVRAAARTRDGVWHVGGAWVEATGGGCTVPGASRSSGSWVDTLNQVQGRFYPRGAGARLRLRVMHPMDTGLVSGIPAFYIDELSLADRSGTEYLRLLTFEPVSENPIFSFDLAAVPPGGLTVRGRDNNGNRISAVIAR